MRLSRYLVPTLKELPSDADTVSARLMLRAGLIRKVASGLYQWLPFGLRALKKVEQIIREELNRVEGQEVWLPVLQPKELWEETGRWQVYGKELVRLKDRKNAEFCLAPTAEEVITDMVRREVRSYRELPLLLYQFGTKFRDEIRPRFGVMRAREFYMKDAYSFHRDEKDLEKTYKDVFSAYHKIFDRCGLKFRPVEADTGAIGGNFSHEFMVLADTGEETIAACQSCGYAANIERAEAKPPAVEHNGTPADLEEVDTPNTWTVEDVAQLMKLPKSQFIKTLFYMVDNKPVVALLRGDHELNEAKLKRVLGAEMLYKASDETYQEVAKCDVGYAGPQGLDVAMVADHAVSDIVNGVSGANKKDKHLKNINVGRDYTPSRYADIRLIQEIDFCPKCRGKVMFHKGIEVGHTFQLGTKYSKSMDAGYLNEKGEKVIFTMGCYGVGVSRVVAAAIEQSHDENGIIWPSGLAPFDVTLLPLNMSQPHLVEASEKIYKDLVNEGVEVLMDDRDQRAGVKFKDADLLGIPWRIIVGDKKLKTGKVELKNRKTGQAEDIELTEVVDVFRKKIHP